MTPPRTPDHDSHDADEIVDMTPVFTEDEAPQESVASTPVYQPEDGSEEFVDMTPALASDEDAQAIAERTAERTAHTQVNKPERGLATASAHMPKSEPAPLEPAPPAEAPPEKRPDAPRRSRKKLVLVAVVGLVVVAFAGKVLGQSIGSGAANLMSGNNASHGASPSVVNTPTPNAVQVGNKKITTAPGPLILLNPGIVRQGTSVGVTGSGFDPGAVIDLTIERQGAKTAQASTFVQADKGGTFANGSIDVPTTLSSGSFIVVAKERNSTNSAQAVGTIAGGAPQVKLGTAVGKPGDVIVLALHGFAPGETINVFWNTLSGQPVTKFKADSGGGVGQAKIQVPFGAVGNNTFLFVGTTSQSLVAASFLVLQLYPTVKLGSYALKADGVMSFSGSGFGPSERVLVFLNSTNGSPLAVINADSSGTFKNAQGFVVPFAINGKQTLIFMGEQSRAPDAVSFTVLPYTPVVQASTYGGLPGTTVTFYGTGFARDEIVHVFAGHTKSSMGTLVSCFQTDDKGAAAAAGSYLIPGNAQGTLGFALVGEKSGGVGVTSLNVAAPPAPVHTPPQAPYTCPLDPPAKSGPSGQATGTPSATSAQPTSPTAPTPQGKIIPSGQYVAMQRVAYAPGVTSHGRAVLSLAAASQLLVARVAAPGARDGARLVSFDLPHRLWNFLEQLRISPLLNGLEMLWLILVLALNLTLVWRSSRQEAAHCEVTVRENGETLCPPPALLSVRDVSSDPSQHTMLLPPGITLGSASTIVASQPQASPGDRQRFSSDTAKAGASRAGLHTTGPHVRAARCTATWHGGDDQPGHDATFVQTDMQLAGDESFFGLFLVADGRSDGYTGIAASQVAVEHIARRVISALSNSPSVLPHLIRPLFKYAVMQAGDTLLAQNATYHAGASTSVTGALVLGERAYIVNVGNSRTYVYSREGGLRQITRDHSVVFGMVSAGLVGATAIDASPRAQQLYRSLGDADRPSRADTFAIAMLPGDQLLLCSDGLWRKVLDSRIEAILHQTADPREATWELIQAASENGSEDDISAIVVHMLGAESREELLPRA